MKPEKTGGTRHQAQGFLPVAFCLVPFAVLATLNSAGYRYGAADQAFYVPAVLLRLDPALFPRDASLIASQAHLTLVDETIAALARLTGASLPGLFATMYIVSLGLLATAAWLIGLRLYRSRWTAVALVAAFTLRHAIAQSGTNTLEGYFHPRQAAFALGALGIAALLHERRALSAALVALAACVHPTTAMWFGLWLGVALAVDDRRVRISLIVAGVVAGIAGGWALTMGPLAGRLAIMDPEWLATLSSRDYLFPFGWQMTTWLVNLAYAPIIWLVYRRRAAAGAITPFEAGLVAGCLALLAVFLVSLPFNAARVALAVQLQVPRVFWMLDFMATVYATWALAEGAGRTNPRRAQLVAASILVASTVRGAYVVTVRFAERSPIQFDIANNDWGRVMAWARTTPAGASWLADPLHAVKYGTSVRVAGHRDVLVEEVKDTAIGMYDRPVAMRTRDRVADVGDFASLDAPRAQALARQYDLDYLVVDRPVALPLAFESGNLRVYRLR